MYKSILALAFLLSLSSSMFGQVKEYELNFLKDVLGVSRTTPIVSAVKLKLPEDSPLKVFVATNTEVKVRDNFLAWIAAWNQEDGKKYGAIEIVPEASQATVIIARYAFPPASQAIRNEESSSINEPLEIDPATRKPVSPAAASRTPLTSKFSVPIYSYIILNNVDGLKIIRSGADSVIVTSPIAYTSVTQDSSTSTTRVNEKVNAGELTMKGRKDSKAPGDKLRDEFFKMMKTRGQQK